MPYIDHIDGPNRDIYLHSDTVSMGSIHPIEIYKEMRTLRASDASLQNFKLFLRAKGNESKGGGKSTERYVVCLDGARIVPYNVSHNLLITGVIITDDEQEGRACFDRSPLSPTTLVEIDYSPPQVEVVVVTTGGSALTTEEHDKLMALPNASTVANAVLDEVG